MANNGKPTNPDEVTHPLQRLDPDSWLNIPVCLVKAVKAIVDSTISQDQKMRQMGNTSDTSTRKLTAALAKTDKDLAKKEEQLKQLIERMEKHLTANFTQKTTDLESMCWRNRDSTNDLNNKFGKEIHDIQFKMDNSMMTSQQIKEHVEYALDQQLALIRLEYKSDLYRVETILQGFQKQFEIPGVVGGEKNVQYASVQEFMSDTYKGNQKNFESMQKRLYEIENKQFKEVRGEINKLHTNVEKFNQNFNEEFWTQYNKLLNDLKSVSSTLSDQNEKMSSMDTSITTKLKHTQDMMIDLKSEMALKQLTIDSMTKQINELRTDMGDSQNLLKTLGSDLAQCQQKVTKIDRAQASQQQMSMASFHHDPVKSDSRGAFNKKATAGAGAASENGQSASGAAINSVEVEKLKVRIMEIERILMSQEITMKKLGDEEAEAIVNANHSSSAGTSLNNKSAAKFDRDWTQKVELKLSKISSTIKALTNKVTDIMHNGKTRDNIFVGHGGTLDTHHNRRSQSVLTGGSQNSLKFGTGIAGDGTPGNSEYNRRGTATAAGGSRKKRRDVNSQDSQGTLSNGNFIDAAKMKNIDQSRSTSPPSNSGHNRRSSAGNTRSNKNRTAPPRDNSIDEKTAKHMMKIAEMINQSALKNAPMTNYTQDESKKKYQRQHTVGDAYIQLSPGAGSGSRSPKNDNIGGPLIGDKLFSMPKEKKTPLIGQRQGRQMAQTPNANVPELQLATFSNQINGQPQGVKPLYVINEENNILMQRSNGFNGQQIVLPDLKKAGHKKVQQIVPPANAAQLLNDEMQSIIRGGQMSQGSKTTAHRRIPSSQLSNRQNSPHGEAPSYLQTGIYHQQPLAVKFEGIQQITGPAGSTGVTTPMLRR